MARLDGHQAPMAGFRSAALAAQRGAVGVEPLQSLARSAASSERVIGQSRLHARQHHIGVAIPDLIVVSATIASIAPQKGHVAGTRSRITVCGKATTLA